MKYILPFLSLFMLFSFVPAHKKLIPAGYHCLKMKEPSDVCLSSRGTSLLIASGDRHLYETDLDGKIIMQSALDAYDLEAVYCDKNYVYTSEESFRKVYQLDISTLKEVRSYNINYNGPRNKGFESITWNASKNCFVMMTEKNPCLMYELDKNFSLIEEKQFPQYSEISAMTYYDNYMWILSDEDMTIYKADPLNYSIIDQWEIPIINPEGVAFDNDGNLYITSDDMGRLYKFDKPGL